ncbi:hypothetical protein H6G33_36510 [Calothrix sp. FACHB-1219]|uniref:hypothetical protein n=1 Tax=unclassified Calothrix TaxID=2619626 RepID=UPI001688C510|nr:MULTISPECIES: hypothetical protein [unclassified Calothrix]MBD2207828.1 hypothetical protein [Calothrix sp. FACHB-168]MBD2222436.1 hypothetical protein [Calothrix sp. FACHB-1219]
MAHPKRGLTDPTGEKQAAREAANQERDRKARERVKAKLAGVGVKAQEIASTIGTTLEPITNTVSSVANVATTATASAINTANNIRQADSPTGTGYQHSYASSQLQINQNPYGDLVIPQLDFNSLVPSDLLHPSALPQSTDQDLTNGLAHYAGATRALQLYQAGFKYINEVGKTKQEYHKAQQSVIKSATEQVKVNQEIVRFDRQNVELAIEQEKLQHSNERLKQAQITTTALANETSQLALKFEAQEQKRDAEIKSIQSQSQDIIQKYLKDSISNGV